MPFFRYALAAEGQKQPLLSENGEPELIAAVIAKNWDAAVRRMPATPREGQRWIECDENWTAKKGYFTKSPNPPKDEKKPEVKCSVCGLPIKGECLYSSDQEPVHEVCQPLEVDQEDDVHELGLSAKIQEHIALHILYDYDDISQIVPYLPLIDYYADCPWCLYHLTRDGRLRALDLSDETKQHLAVHILQAGDEMPLVASMIADKTYIDCPMCDMWR